MNAVDDPPNATVYLGGVVRRAGVTVGISTDGAAPALAGLLREAIDAMLPHDLETWMLRAHELRREWRDRQVPMADRRPELLDALNALYAAPRRRARRVAIGAPVPPAGARPVNGLVSLVGAGPGRPRAPDAESGARLAEADLVLYDALIEAETLGFATQARRFFVGKRAGRPPSTRTRSTG